MIEVVWDSAVDAAQLQAFVLGQIAFRIRR